MSNWTTMFLHVFSSTWMISFVWWCFVLLQLKILHIKFKACVPTVEPNSKPKPIEIVAFERLRSCLKCAWNCMGENINIVKYDKNSPKFQQMWGWKTLVIETLQVFNHYISIWTKILYIDRSGSWLPTKSSWSLPSETMDLFMGTFYLFKCCSFEGIPFWSGYCLFSVLIR